MSQSTKLSPGAQQALEFIENHVQEYGYSPTVREIGHELGLSSSQSAHRYLQELKKKGYIDYVPNKTRTIRVTR